jgi:hypothetical protein
MIREFSSRHIDWGTRAILPFIQVAKRNKSPALEQGGTLVLSHERIAQSFSSIKGRCWTVWYFGGRIASRMRGLDSLRLRRTVLGRVGSRSSPRAPPAVWFRCLAAPAPSRRRTPRASDSGRGGSGVVEGASGRPAALGVGGAFRCTCEPAL